MKAEDEIFLVGGDLAAFDGGAEVVHPAEAAALTAAEEAGSFWKRSPATFAFFPYETGQHLVFLRCPWPSLQPNFAAARSSSSSRAIFIASSCTVLLLVR